MSELLVFLVVVPLFGSVTALLAGLAWSRTGWPIATLTAVTQLGVAAVVAGRAFRGTPLQYVPGGFTAPFGIQLVVDGLSATIALLVAVVALGVLGYARAAGPRSNAFYATYLLLVAGLSGMSITGDIFNMYVFLEITGLAAYALVATGTGARAARAALNYLIVGTVGASLFLLGIGFAYVATGTLNMADLATQLAAVGYGSPLVQASFALLVVGLFVKVAVFPVHTWQPTAYAGAPDSVSAFISALVSTVAAYALIRIVFSVFTVEFLTTTAFARQLLIVGAVVSIVLGSAFAVTQREIKRTLAYSSVSQFGLIVGAVAVANGTALTGAVIHLVGHAVMKGGLFLTSGLVTNVTGAETVDDYDGLVDRFPAGSVAFAVLALAMIGVPPAIGFVGKWYVVLGAVEAEAWTLVVVLLASTLLTLAYFARLIERMFFRDAAEPSPTTADGLSADGSGPATDPTAVSLGMQVTVIVAVTLSVLLGVGAFEYGQLLQPTVERLLT